MRAVPRDSTLLFIGTRAIRAAAFVSNDTEINFLTHPRYGGWLAMRIQIKSMITGCSMIARQLFTEGGRQTFSPE